MNKHDFQCFYDHIKGLPLIKWSDFFKKKLINERNPSRHGNFESWLSTYQNLPAIAVSSTKLNQPIIQIGSYDDCDDLTRQRLKNSLRNLHPWRKGPFNFFGIHLDAEWRSDKKWQRIQPHLQDLKDRLILDVGCGNGYYSWRMLGAGARFVLGIDPNTLFLTQFWSARRYIGARPAHLLPFALEDMPENMPVFDTVFSMGVLYHRRSPMEHLFRLRNFLRRHGELVLETLIIDGNERQMLVPDGRYAKMRNVWLLPSCAMLKTWLIKAGFTNIRLVDVTQTTVEEQRSTEWMQFESLPDFLDPLNNSLTIEGHPAPTRAVFIAENPKVV